MNNSFLILILLILVNSLSFAEDDTQIRDVRDFNGIYLADIGETQIIRGNREGIVIQARKNLFPKIKTNIKYGILTVKTTGFFPAGSNIKFTIYIKQLKFIRIAATQSAFSSSIDTGSLYIELDADGKLQIESLNAKKIDVKISGMGECILKGKVDEQNIYLSGSGSYDGKNLVSENAIVRMTGSGKVTVNVIDTLSSSISGNGILNHIGNPKIENTLNL